ncbi:circadian clock-controlled protein [Clostridium botulinum]|nr:circadian clock-controlled protein [Clostridium botulinum]
MARKISVSFKETSKDLKLYNYLNSLDDKSADIKDLLRKALKDVKLDNDKIKKNVDEDVNILDF